MALMLLVAGLGNGQSVGDAANIAARVQELRAELAYHDRLYFEQAAPEISDYAYDQLKARLRELLAAHPEIADQLAAEMVGDDRGGGFALARHGVPMLSLDKSYARADVDAFVRRVEASLDEKDTAFVLEPKVDGVAINLVYEAGQFTRAITRGDGTYGDDVTANVRMIAGLPWTLAGDPRMWPERLEVRGEVYVPWAVFRRLNAERLAADEEPFATPRNLAAGSIKLHDVQAVQARKLAAVMYGLGQCVPGRLLPDSQTALREQLAAWGFPVLANTWLGRGAEGIAEGLGAFAQVRPKLPFATDGAVIKVDAVAAQQRLGLGPTAPRWAMAFKYAPDRARTMVTGITIQVGRTGRLTPVAELAPVELTGTTVARVTLHSAGALERLDVRVGDVVWVEKAGDVIPALSEVELAARSANLPAFVFPASCPACAEAIEREGAFAYCRNPACPPQITGRLVHWASRPALNIDGLGPALAEKLVEAGLANDPLDLYALTEDQLVALAGVGTISASRLVEAIAASRDVSRDRVLVGLGWAGVGPATARQLIAAYPEWRDLASAEEAGLQAAGLGAASAEAVLSQLQSPRGATQLVRLAQMAFGSGALTGPLSGLHFVLTGRLPQLTRRAAQTLIETAGGIVSSGINGETDYLIAGERPSAGKLAKANALSIPVLDEAGLRALLE